MKPNEAKSVRKGSRKPHPLAVRVVREYYGDDVVGDGTKTDVLFVRLTMLVSDAIREAEYDAAMKAMDAIHKLALDTPKGRGLARYNRREERGR